MGFKNGFKDMNAERYMLIDRIKKLNSYLRGYCYDDYLPLHSFEYVEANCSLEEAKQHTWRAFNSKKEKVCGAAKSYWLRHSFIIPECMDGKKVEYCTDNSQNEGWMWGTPQILLYVNGEAFSAMDIMHQSVVLSNNAKAGDKFEIYISSFNDISYHGGDTEISMCLRSRNDLATKLWYDVNVPLNVAEVLDENDIKRVVILEHLNNALSFVDFRLNKGEEFNATVKKAINYLEKEFYKKVCGQTEANISCVGHSHIDTAWLWPLEMTQKKVERTFATVNQLMDTYQDMTFMSSQPQLYQFLKERQPALYQKIKERIDNGNWEPEGGMWVEADTNIPCGESLVRQFLFGKGFFKKEFGWDNKILWLPDVFGYSGALPQIMKKCGIDYFMTTKISWNEYDKFPFDTFNWVGIDGSSVLTHFICDQNINSPAGQYFTTYNGYINPHEVMGSWRRYQQKDLGNHILMNYGFGDGGGGPTSDMLEQYKRINRGIPGCPKLQMSTPRKFFNELDKSVSGNKRLPSWKGELYFEYHRGTYTSIAKIKKNMRKSEILVQDIELFASIRDRLLSTKAYPAELLDNSWRAILLNQFHDILPGSSIKEVYDDSDKQFASLFTSCNSELCNILDDISQEIKTDGLSITVFNSSSFERTDIVELTLDKEYSVFDGGKELAHQYTDEGNIYLSPRTFLQKVIRPSSFLRQQTRALRRSGLIKKALKTNSSRALLTKMQIFALFTIKELNATFLQKTTQ